MEQRPEPGAYDSEQREAFFTRVVGEHARLLFRVANSVLRDAAEAEDAVGDALAKLLRGESWRRMTNERAFLVRVVWRAAFDRRAARRLTVGADVDLFGLRDGRASPEAAAVAGDERGLLQELIDRLAEDLRAPLLLSAIEELNSREIAEVLKVHEGTVRTRLMRARSELRRMFATECGTQAVPLKKAARTAETALPRG